MYAEYIQKTCRENPNAKFALIKLDNDSIPRLFYSGISEAEGESITTYCDGKLVTELLPRLGSRYIAGIGMIFTDTGHMDYYPAKIIKLENGKFNVIGSGIHVRRYGLNISIPEYNPKQNEKSLFADFYIWEGRQVTEKEYYQEIDKIFDRNLGQLPETYPATEVLRQLGTNFYSESIRRNKTSPEE